MDAKHIVLATLTALAREKQIKPDVLQKAVKELGINPEKANPANTGVDVLARAGALHIMNQVRGTSAERDARVITGPHSKPGSKYSVTEFKLPELGENIEQGDLVRLLISPGASVTEGQPVMELETDKAVVEVPSSVTGTVKDIRVKEGQKIKVGQVIFTVDNGAGAKTKTTETKAPQKASAEKPPAEKAVAPAAARPAPASSACRYRCRRPRARLNLSCPSLGRTSIRAIWCG